MYDTTAVRENGDIRATRLEGALFGDVKGGDWMLNVVCQGQSLIMYGGEASVSATIILSYKVIFISAFLPITKRS